MNVSQFEKAVRHWRGPKSHERETRNHRFEPVSAIEAILEFSQISWHVFGAHGSVSSNQRGFNISQDGVHPFESRLLGSLRSTAGADGGVYASNTGHRGEAGEPVGDDVSAGINRGARQHLDRRLAQAGDTSKDDLVGFTLFGRRDGRYKGRLAVRAAPTLARPGPADVSVVHLHRALQALT